MRIFTALSGIILASGGAFCYIYQTHAFADLAFVMGLLMIMSGLLCAIAYLISGREQRLPDTLLVECMITMLFGFAVLNNQVGETMVSIFFGAWLTTAGASRLSQSIAVSRFNPKEWARVLPLAAICTLLGTVMMMPTLVSTINPLMLTGVAFILDGLSQIIYAMYMQNKGHQERAQEAIARAEAKKQAAKEKSAQEQMLREMNETERQKLLEEEREKKRKAKEKSKEEKRLAREAKKEARQGLEKTLELTEEEVDDIRRQTESAYEAGQLPAEKVREPEAEETPEQNLYPTFKRPTDIPSLRANAAEEDEDTSRPETDEVKIAAINLEELEDMHPEVNFDPVELPEVSFVSEEHSPVDRNKVMRELNRAVRKEERIEYTPVSLDELIAEPMKKRSDEEKDNKRFTNTFVFNWDELPVKDRN